MEKIWFQSYPCDVPPQIDPDVHLSLTEMILTSVEKYGERSAFYNMGVTLTFNEIKHKACLFAAYLQNELGLQKNDRIALMLPNVLHYPIVLFASLFSGLIVVNVNPLYTVEEFLHQMQDAKVKAIVVLANVAHTVEQALPQLPTLQYTIICNMGDFFSKPKAFLTHLLLKYYHKKLPDWHIPHSISFIAALQKGQNLPFHFAKSEGQDIAFLQYTGGTTGLSKGAILTHRNLVANITQSYSWYRTILTSPQEIVINALPFYHIFSLTANCLFFFFIGGLDVLITNPRDTNAMIATMAKFPFTAMTGVNTLFNILLKNARFERLNFSYLKLVLGGGMAVQAVIASQWHRVTGTPILEAYGLTETSPCVAMNPYTEKNYNGTVGLPVPSTDVSILDVDGNELPIGEMGEIAVKGPQVMKGYWHNEVETGKVFTKDGWLLTGDIGSFDTKGYLKILERKKDMIIVSGFNVYPTEIENVIARMPEVREVAVVGIKDDNSGEAVKACVVKQDDSLTAQTIIRFCHQYLTGYKIPKIIVFYDALPKSTVGKILRRALKE